MSDEIEMAEVKLKQLDATLVLSATSSVEDTDLYKRVLWQVDETVLEILELLRADKNKDVQ